jgi:glutathione S-transferase
MCWWIGGPEAAIDTLAWEVLIKPKVFNQPGNDPGIVADAHRRIERYLPVLDKQLEGRDYVVGPLTTVDFLIGPRLDTAPAILKFDTSGYANIGAWQERLKAKPYWSTA